MSTSTRAITREVRDMAGSYVLAPTSGETVAAGYKRTEVGVIPEEWQVHELADLKPFITSGSRGWADYYSNHGSAFIRITNMSRSSIYLDLDDLRLVNLPPDSTEGVRTQLHDDDLLVSITADIGIIALVDQSVPKPAYINQHIALVRLDAEKVNSKFLSYFLAGAGSQKAFRAGTDQGAKAGMNLRGVREIKAAFPPLVEQRAIAAALSDVDVLLAKLDQLIAKKRDLKQAAMQQLLLGHVRLPGFAKEWRSTLLGSLGRFSKGRGIRKDQVRGDGLPCIRYGEIYTRHHDVVHGYGSFISSDVASQSQRLQNGDLLFAGSGETSEEIGKCVAFLDDCETYAGGDIVIFTPVGQDSMFLGYLMNQPVVTSQKARMGQGDAVVHISARNLAQIELKLPARAEQTAIATILSDVDAELAELGTRRAKTRELKRGMMQALLTGRIRLG